MKILWLLFLLHTALGQTGFGRSYLRNSRLCHQWSCVNSKLGLPDALPPSEEFARVLRGILPGSWLEAVERVTHACYHDRPRRYTNTCPGQALMHCAVDQLINNCPEESLRKDDACAPVNSLAGVNNMFSQSRYENLERNLPLERRPSWFLRNYFDTKCCNLPDLINSTVLSECGFTTMMQYYNHNPQFQNNAVLPSQRRNNPIVFHTTPTEASYSDDSLQVVDLKDIMPAESSEPLPDPLECCDISAFIQPAWRHDCGFQVQWTGVNRLTVTDGGSVATEAPTPTVTTVLHRDLVVLPHSCEKETCVFDKLNITSAGAVDMEAFTKLLDNLTDHQPQWNSAKARVLTSCLAKPLRDYDADCDINIVLACTFDVLSENCPSKSKNDTCKHTKDDRICQISSSKSRPKNRRSTCVLPELVNRSVLAECGLHTLSRVEQSVNITTTQKKHSLFSSKYRCKDLTPSTSCVMNKMGALNKYGFMDYFKMKDRIRHFTDQNEWSPLLEAYMSAFTNIPLYGEHCNSAKKLLNVLDSIMMTCPDSKKKNTPQCSKLFADIANTPASKVNATKEHVDQILKHFHHVFFPSNPVTSSITHPKYTSKIVKKPIYDYGVLSSKYVPEVQIIDVKPKVAKKPLVLLPVYMRVPYSNFAFKPYHNDGVMRSPFALHNQIAQAHRTTSSSPIISTSKPVPLSTSTSVNFSTSTLSTSQ